MDDLVALLLECHQRIRAFSELALLVSAPERVSADQARDACARVHRYFSEALPLHVRDEEDSIVPRLRGHWSTLDAALERMTGEHAAHQQLLQDLLTRCAAVAADSGAHAREAAAIGRVAHALEREFAAHLDAEEMLIFPALRELPEATQRQIVKEMRLRRAGPTPGHG